MAVISTGIHPYAGFQFLIFAFTACVVGGLGNLMGTVLAGIILGVLVTFAEAYSSSLAAEALTMLVLVVVLLTRPRGLFPLRIRAF